MRDGQRAVESRQRKLKIWMHKKLESQVKLSLYKTNDTDSHVGGLHQYYCQHVHACIYQNISLLLPVGPRPFGTKEKDDLLVPQGKADTLLTDYLLTAQV